MSAQHGRVWVRVLRPFYVTSDRVVKTGEKVQVSRDLLGQLLLANRAVVCSAPTEDEARNGDA